MNGGTPPDISETPAGDATEDPTAVFRFAVHMTELDAAPVEGQPLTSCFSATRWSAITRALDATKPAHTTYVITTTQMDGFLCDDPDSLTDNTVLAS